MKLNKTTFDQLDVGAELIFMNHKGYVVHCNKIGKSRIRYLTQDEDYLNEAETSYCHEVYQILDGIYEFKQDKEINT